MKTKKKKPVKSKKPKTNEKLKKAILKTADKHGDGDLIRAALGSGRLVIL